MSKQWKQQNDFEKQFKVLLSQTEEDIPNGYQDKPGPIELPAFRGTTEKRPKKTSPDISKGLGRRQEAKDYVALEKYIIDSGNWMVHQGDLCIFKTNRWVRLRGKNQGIREIRRIFQDGSSADCLKASDYKQVYEGLLTNPHLEALQSLKMPEYCVNCRDGVLNLLTLKSRENRPEDHYFSVVNISCDEIIDPPMEGSYFERFMNQIGNGDPEIRQQILEMIAVVLAGFQLKGMYVMVGQSNSGKSQIGKFLQELVRSENTATIRSLNDFADRYTVGSMQDKLLALCMDLPNKALSTDAVATLKQFVGDDSIKGEAKYKDPITLVRKPILVCASNHPIQLRDPDSEEALKNRVIHIPFYNSVLDESEMIKDLFKFFLKEAPYIIHQAALAFQAMHDRNWAVTRVPLPEEYDFEESGMSEGAVQAFVQARLMYEDGAQITSDQLFNAFRDFCEQENYPLSSKITFSRSLRRVLEDYIPEAQYIKRVGTKGLRGYKNIALQEEGDLP